MLELTAALREKVGTSSRKLLSEGAIPAVVYGPKVESTPITIDMVEFQKARRDAGESTLIKLSGLPEEHEVLIQEVDEDPVTSVPRHVDLYAVERGKEIEVTVSLEYVGESPAVKNGEQLVKVLHEIEVRATPGNLPSEIEVDISGLANVGDHILIKDLPVADDVTITNDPENTVALIQEHKEEEEEEPEAIDMDSIEVESKGKDAEGEEGDDSSGEEEKEE